MGPVTWEEAKVSQPPYQNTSELWGRGAESEEVKGQEARQRQTESTGTAQRVGGVCTVQG